MKKLFVSDVDSTLLLDGETYFRPQLISALKLAIENEGEFVLCSGRPTRNLIDLAHLLKEHDDIHIKFVGGYNGVELYDMDKELITIDHSLNIEQVKEIKDVVDSYNLEYLYFDDNAKLLRSNIPDNHWVKRESTFTHTPIGPNDAYCRSQKVLLIVDPRDNDRLKELLEKELSNYAIFESAPHFIEIVQKGINKSSVLKEVAELEGIDHEHTYGFGDSGNDLELIKYAHTGVVVANGIDRLKEAADVIVDTCENEGVAKFIMSLYE